MTTPEEEAFDAEVVRPVADAVARLTTHPLLSAAVVLGLTALATALLPHLRIETDVSRLLPEKNEVTQAYRALDAETGSSRFMLMEVRGPELSGSLPGFVERLRASPYLERVDATRDELFSGGFDRYAARPLWYVPDDTLAALQERLSPEGRKAAIRSSVERLADDPIGGTEIVLADPLDLRSVFTDGAEALVGDRFELDSPYVMLAGGETAVLRVTGKSTPFDTPFTKALLADVRARAEGLELNLIGAYARVEGDAGRIGRDLVVSALVSCLLVALFLAFALRSAADVAAVLIPVLMALYWTMPVGGALLGALTPLTMSSAAILMGLGVDFSIHYLSKYRDARCTMSHFEAVKETLRSVGQPLLTALFTTALAFLSFVLAEFDGLRVFGWLLALGLAFAFLSCLFVTPWVAMLTRDPEHPTTRTQSIVVRAVAQLRGRPLGHALTWAMPAFGLLGFVVAATLGIGFSTDSRHLRPYSDPTWAAERGLEERLGHALTPLQLVFPAGTDLDEIRRGFSELEFGLAFSDRPDLASVAPTRAPQVQAFLAATEGWADGTRKDLAAVGFDPGPFAPALEDYRRRFEAPLEDVGIKATQLLDRPVIVVRAWPDQGIHEVRRWPQIRAAVAGAFNTEPEVSHVYALLFEMQEVLGRDLRKAGIITAIIALVLLIPLCGGLRPGLVAAVPAFSTLGVTLGVMAAFDIPLNMSNCVGVPFLIGIGVDAGIHLIAELRQEDLPHLLSPSGRTAEVAVWRTSATTALAFGSLWLATVPGIASLGLMMMIGVTTAFVTSMLVLPAAWVRLRPSSSDGLDASDAPLESNG